MGGFAEIQRQWQALFQPEKDAVIASSETIQPWQTGASFDLTTAWWLAQLCHVAYIRDTCHRQEQLASANLLETASFGKMELHWSRIEPMHGQGTTIIAFRGSSDPRHWLFNLGTLMVDFEPFGKVHLGFKKAFELLLEPLAETLGNANGQVIFTGHSLGAALAALSLTHWPGNCAYAFGCPRIGNTTFVRQLEAKATLFRVLNGIDLLQFLPNEIDLLPGDLRYTHAGKLIKISTDGTLEQNARDPGAPGYLNENLLHWLDSFRKPGELLPTFRDHSPCEYVKSLTACRLQSSSPVD